LWAGGSQCKFLVDFGDCWVGETHLSECSGRAVHYKANTDGNRIVQIFRVVKKISKCLDKLVIRSGLLGFFNLA